MLDSGDGVQELKGRLAHKCSYLNQMKSPVGKSSSEL